MFHHNETEQFMDENFQPEDYKFLCKMAHDADSHKLEAMRKKAQVEYDQARNAKKAAARGDCPPPLVGEGVAYVTCSKTNMNNARRLHNKGIGDLAGAR